MEEQQNDEARTWEPMDIEEAGHVGEVMQITSKFSGAQYNGGVVIGDDTF
jgi:hypothetical protein